MAMNLQKDYKAELSSALQKHVKRPISKADVMYTVNRFGSQCQAVVKLNCLGGQEYAGHLSSDPRTAEKSAAEQAFMANQATFAASGSLTKVVAPKAPGAIATPSAAKRPGEWSAGPSSKRRNRNGEEKVKLPESEMVHKTELNNACQQIVRRAIGRGEIAFTFTEIGGQFQATVQCPFLPEDFASRAWAGDLKDSKQAAEQSAAAQAVIDIKNAPEFAEKLAEPTKSKPKSKKGVFRKAMNSMFTQMMQEGTRGQTAQMMSWFANGCQGPAPREVVTPTPVTGTVLEWKGTFGWIKADVAIDHEAAQWKDGKIYIHKNDFKTGSGLTELVEGQRVRFKVHADHNGLGADDCTRA
eukprot:TRINITY_DN77119_c0_g1_i1.p1 TRINITY_DN77119_c0_g1~~TRINITY_DN77119_c0_g1_i1.p1  ORF type:complete len:355 (+),score=87.58 TRINITY_DN77119_c0_g1_i1:75-1139(+)